MPIKDLSETGISAFEACEMFSERGSSNHRGYRTMPHRILATLAFLLLSAGPAMSGPPAAIPEHDSHRRAVNSFESFASGWMEKMARAEAQNRAKPQIRPYGSRTLITYRGYGNDFDIEVKNTGYAPAPFIGILRYSEKLYTCVDSAATRCQVASTTPVTEIFRFQGGRWVY
jgi:hypothetical protein